MASSPAACRKRVFVSCADSRPGARPGLALLALRSRNAVDTNVSEENTASLVRADVQTTFHTVYSYCHI
jgi:hypothetical protein